MMIPRQRLGERHRAGVGRKLPGQQLEQRRFAGAVGADQADSVAALDAQREVANDRPLAIAFADVVGVDHGLGADIVLGQRELGGAGGAEHRGPLRAHLVKLGEAALVAPPPRGHPALQPVKLELELGVELLGGSRFLIVDSLGPGLEAAKTDFRAPQLAAIEPDAALASAASGRCGRG